MLEAHLTARLQAEEFLRRILHKVLAVDVEFAPKGNVPLPAVRRAVLGEQILCLAFGIVGNDEFQRMQYRHDARRVAVQLVAYAVLEHCAVHRAVALGDADLLTERTDRCGRITASPHPRDRRHTRIVPPAHMPLLNELTQLALARDRAREIQTCELDLTRPLPRRESQSFEQPVIERAMLLELQRTERVRNALNRIREWMGKVVHRIDAPRIARPMMRHMGNAVDHGIAHDEIRRRHIDLGAQNARSVRKLPRTHAREEIQILLDRTPAMRTLHTGLGQRTAVGTDLLRREIIHIGKPLLNQLDCIFIQLLKIVRGIESPISP